MHHWIRRQVLRFSQVPVTLDSGVGTRWTSSGRTRPKRGCGRRGGDRCQPSRPHRILAGLDGRSRARRSTRNRSECGASSDPMDSHREHRWPRLRRSLRCCGREPLLPVACPRGSLARAEQPVLEDAGSRACGRSGLPASCTCLRPAAEIRDVGGRRLHSGPARWAGEYHPSSVDPLQGLRCSGCDIDALQTAVPRCSVALARSPGGLPCLWR
jgi:hypothetical protein